MSSRRARNLKNKRAAQQKGLRESARFAKQHRQKCGKKPYGSSDHARSAARGIAQAQQRRIKKPNLRPYYCHECAAWHLTSQPLKRSDAA